MYCLFKNDMYYSYVHYTFDKYFTIQDILSLVYFMVYIILILFVQFKYNRPYLTFFILIYNFLILILDIYNQHIYLIPFEDLIFFDFIFL